MKKRVLIIDDEEDECLMLVAYLQRKNYTVHCAHTLAEGLRMLMDVHPDTLLLDNNLPDGLGWKEAEQIHRLYPNMHITLISANEASPYAIMADGIGFQKMEKPISLHSIEAFL